MKNCLPFTDDGMVVLVHNCVQQTHLLALHLETLGFAFLFNCTPVGRTSDSMTVRT